MAKALASWLAMGDPKPEYSFIVKNTFLEVIEEPT